MLPEQLLHTLIAKVEDKVRRPTPKQPMLHRPAHRQTMPDPDNVEQMRIDFPACIEKQFPLEFPTAWSAIQKTLEATADADLSGLAQRSPGLAGFNWSEYLRCSVARMVRVLSAVSHYCPRGGRILDYGSYFGNTSLMCAMAGFNVESVDSYRRYGVAFQRVQQQLVDHGVKIMEFDDVGYDFSKAESGCYDMVLCMGLVEHVPHTPRLLMETLDQLLRPRGTLILDTPNLAYLYNRQKALRGESTFLSLELQYYTELPFEGHHREYTVAEIEWMLKQLGHRDISIDTFLYSVYSLPYLQGRELRNYRLMQLHADMREYILSVSRKSTAAEREQDLQQRAQDDNQSRAA